MQGSSDLSVKIELFLSCRSLRDMDVFSKSDPYVRVSFRRDFTHHQYVPLGRTETAKNNINPDFAKTFVLDYLFESQQHIHFEVFDDDGDGSQDDFIGRVETTVGELMGARSQTAILELRDGKGGKKSSGKLIVRCEGMEQTNGMSGAIIQQRSSLIASYLQITDCSTRLCIINRS